MTTAQTAPQLFREPVAGRDGIWLQDRSANQMVINSIFTVDHLETEDLRRLWSERIDAKGERYARFHRKIVYQRGKAFWEDDPDYSVERHIVLAPPLEKDPDALSTREALEEYLSELASGPLPAGRPAWRMEVIPNYRDGSSAVITRLHHVIGDGMSVMPVLFTLMDNEAEGDDLIKTQRFAEKAAKPITTAAKVAAAVGSPYFFGQKVAWRRDQSPIHGPPLSGQKRVAWSDAIDLERIKVVKDALGATINDVIMSCVGGAFERYVTSRGASLGQLRVTMPVNIRPPEELPKIENKFAAVLIPLPVGFDDVRRRLAATKRRMDKLKRSPEPLFTYGAASVMLATLPRAASGRLIDYLANKTTAVVSNVPGPAHPMYLAGRRLRAMLFWVPQRADIGIGISILSYDGTLMVGVFADVALIPEPGQWTDAFHAELAALEAVI